MSFEKSMKPFHHYFVLLAVVVTAAIAYLTSFARPVEHFRGFTRNQILYNATSKSSKKH